VGEGRSARNILLGKSESKKSLGRARRRRANNMKMDLKELGVSMWNCFIRFRILTCGGIL
jgi:hypothetical protein